MKRSTEFSNAEPLPKIVRFDGYTITTERGSFTITPVTYADGGKSPRLSDTDLIAIRSYLIHAYIESTGQSLREVERMAYDARHFFCYKGKHDESCVREGRYREVRP